MVGAVRALAGSAAVAGALCAGCAVLPYPVTPETVRTEDVELGERAYVTVGPRRLLARMSEAVIQRDARIELVDPLAFRDAAFPEGGWSLRELLRSERCGRLAETLGIRYLVLLGPVEAKYGEEKGFFMPLVLGAQSQSEDRSLGALVVDLARGDVACRLTATASGTQRVVHYVIILVGTLPRTEEAVVEGMADAIAKELAARSSPGPIRAALLALEGNDSPLETRDEKAGR